MVCKFLAMAELKAILTKMIHQTNLFMSKLLKSNGRLMAILVFALVCALSVTAQEKRISLDFNKRPLRTVLAEIEKQSDQNFSFNSSLIDQYKEVTISVKNASFQTVLSKLSEATGLSYNRVTDDVVTVTKKNEPASKKPSKKVFTLKGLITDESNEPLIGATILAKGTNNGASTDITGGYTLNNIKAGDVLVVSYVGYHSKTVTVKDNAPLNIQLAQSANNLDEVVVIGYGTQRKRDVTTAISSVKGSDLADLPANSIEQAIVGKMAGVQVTQGTGMPGGGTQIKVRGTGTVTAGSDPLYVVDGVPLSDLSGDGTGTQINPLGGIDMNDVESIEVLKDASAASIYGSRGANGVILITTKQGSQGRPKVSYSGFAGWQNSTKKIDMLGAYDFARLVYDAHNNAYLDLLESKGLTGSIEDDNATRLIKMGAKAGTTNVTYLVPDELMPYINGETGLTDTDWQDEVLRNGFTTKHSLSVNGGTNGVTYFISGNYAKENGIIINSGQETFGGRANINVKYNNIKFGVNANISHMRYDLVPTDDRFTKETIMSSALAMAPIFPVYNEDGTYNFDNYNWSNKQQAVINPVALAIEREDLMKRNKVMGKAYFNWRIIKGLNFKTEFSTNWNSYRREIYRPSTLPTSVNKVPPSNPEGTVRTKDALSWTWENTLNFNRKFNGVHDVNAVLGQSLQKENIEASRITGNGYPNDLVHTLNSSTMALNWDSSRQCWTLASVFARAQYNYDNKYLVSASLRADGSSRFGENNRWGYFPSVSAGWYLSEENWLKEQTWLDALKLRASYGVSGNFSIGNYEYYSLLTQDNYVLGSGDGILDTGLYPSTIGNPDLGWEKTAMANVGLEIGLFNMLRLEVDLYNSDTSNMLLDVPVPYLSGFATTLQNRGKVNNKGFEITLGTSNQFGDFHWTNNFNFAMNRNRVVDLGGVNEIVTINNSVLYFVTRVGEPIGNYYTLVTDGVFMNEDELKRAADRNDHSIAYVEGAKVGDFKFIDQDGDGVITDNDKKIVGNYAPKFTYGYSTQMSYRWFDLSASIQGVYGNKIANINKRYIDNMEGSINCMTDALNRYIDENNPGNGLTVQANRSATGKNGTISTWHIEDGSYLRIRDITFGVSMPKQWMKKIGVDKFRIYFTTYNPFTFTKYSGYNPEVSNNRNPLTPGVDYGTYPVAKSFVFGLNLNF